MCHRSAVATVGIGLVALLGDRLVAQDLSQDFRAVVDNLTHGAIGAFSWCVVMTHQSNVSLTSRLWEITLCGLLASLIDLDHFVAARSLKILDARSLSSRPFMHCTTMPVATFILLSFLAHFLHWIKVQHFLWIFLTAVLSHHIRDATRRGFWLCPFGSTPPVPYLGYVIACMAFPHLVAVLMHYTGNKSRFIPLTDVLSI